ncbi:MAG: DUF418 domain-containing protein [Rubrobacteraceae bacterium]
MAKNEGMSPVRGAERVVVLDVLRGVGIAGILLVNVLIFSGVTDVFPSAPDTDMPVWDRAAEFLVTVFAEGKFITTLAFLFGLGFALQGMRADERGQSSRRLLLKRICVLGLFGLVHAVFIWSGDILLMYALMGLLLVFFRRRRPRTLLIWAGVCLTLPMILLLFSIVSFALFLTFGDPNDVARATGGGGIPFFENLSESAREAYNSGSYVEMIGQRLRELIIVPLGLVVLGPFVLAMMLLGTAVARAGWVGDLEAHTTGLRRAAVVGLSVGLPLNVIYGVSTIFDPASSGLWGLIGLACWLPGAPALAIGYMSSVTLLVLRRPENGFSSRFAAVGRLALSNYLTQSIVMTAIFYGLAIYGEVSVIVALLVAVALIALQILASPLYLKRFSYGPAEWLWRRLTYGRKPAAKGSA